MKAVQKHLIAVSVASLVWIAPAVAPAQPEAGEARLDELMAELAEPEREDWKRVEAEINRIWSRSGSDSMDLLLRRGNDAIEAEDYQAALDHLSALTDHAPEFAEGWNARATAFFMMGEYGLAIADVQRVLALNPRHFGALTGLGLMLEQLGEIDMALEALRAAEQLNPNRPSITDAVERLERQTGIANL